MNCTAVGALPSTGVTSLRKFKVCVEYAPQILSLYTKLTVVKIRVLLNSQNFIINYKKRNAL